MVLRNVAKTFSLEEQRQEINEIAVDLDAVNTTLANWNAGNWDTAYSWGDHAQAGYWVDVPSDRTNWNTAYGWGDHAQVGYWVDVPSDRTNWNTAYGWGDHAQVGYALSTALANSANWDTSYSWGDHALAGYLTSYTETDPVFGASAASGIAAGDITNWNTAYSWGDHSIEGYAVGTIPNPGGTSAGAGTTEDPFIGSLQFNAGSNSFGGDSKFVWNNTDNRLGVGNSAPAVTVHIRDSDTETQGSAQLKISKGVGSGAAPETITRENLYLHLGSSEWGANSNANYLIGFGYSGGETGTGVPAYIGFNEESTGGYTEGDLVFGTRPNTLGDNSGRERLRITSKGVRQYSCANDSSFAYQGIYQELSGKKQLSASGAFTDIVVHGHSCSYFLQYYLLENDNSALGGGPGSANLFVRYGVNDYNTHVFNIAGMNGGSLNTPELQYINSTAKLQFRASWSGSNPVFIYWHIRGCGDRKLVAL